MFPFFQLSFSSQRTQLNARSFASSLVDCCEMSFHSTRSDCFFSSSISQYQTYHCSINRTQNWIMSKCCFTASNTRSLILDYGRACYLGLASLLLPHSRPNSSLVGFVLLGFIIFRNYTSNVGT